jgi:hypothetical protein
MSAFIHGRILNGTLTTEFLRRERIAILDKVARHRLRNPLVFAMMETRTAGEMTLSVLLQSARMLMYVCPELLTAPDVVGMTAVHYAAQWCLNAKMLELILTHKSADVNANDSFDWRPLHYAASIDNAAAVRQLLDLGADVDAQKNTEYNQFTPLYFALPHPEIASMLLKAGAAATWVGLNGVTLLHCVAEDVNVEDDAIEVARMLLMAGAPLNLRDAAGRTPADCAATMSRPTLFKWLKRAESRTITPGRKWRPPNHWLCRRQIRDAVCTSLLVSARIKTIPTELWFSVFEMLPLHE